MSPRTILTPTQEQVLSLIAAGSTATAAASAGIHRNTISNWLRGSPACISTRLSTGASKPNRSPPAPWKPFAASMADVAAPAAAIRPQASWRESRAKRSLPLWQRQKIQALLPFEAGRFAPRPAGFRAAAARALRLDPAARRVLNR